MDNKPGGLSEPAISGVNSSTVAITGGTITLNGPGIQMVGGTLIIGPEAKVLGIVPQSNAYGAGFVFVNDAKEAQVQGDPVLPVDLKIPEGYTLNVPANTSLTVPEGVTLTVEGAIRVETGGSITGAENISGKVQHKLTEEMVVIEKDSYTYTGEAIEPEVTIEGYDEDKDYTVAYANNTNAGEGEATITITPTETGGLYGEVTMNFTIEKATPNNTVPQGLTATYGQTLADVKLPEEENGTWSWQNPEQLVGDVGDNNTFTAIFTPTDTENYNTITQEVTITVEAKEEPEPEPAPEPAPTYYRVDLRPMEGATIIPSSRVVEEGGTLTFTIEIEEGYVADSMLVTVSQGIGKAVEVKPDEEGIYTIKNVDGLVTITVYGVKEATPVGMENIEGVQVYAHEGAIYVYTPTEKRVMIVAMNGVLKANGEQIGKRRYELPRGFYVVWVEGESFKVAN